MAAIGKKNLAYLGACLHSGQPIKGVQHASQAIRSSGLFESLKRKYNILVNDFGDIHEISEIDSSSQMQWKKSHIENLHILDPSLKLLNDRLEEIILNEKTNLNLTVGGDHSIGSATTHALLGAYPNLKVVWVDAHADIIDYKRSNYPSYHGYPLSHILGINDGVLPGFKWMNRRLKPENVVLIGQRSIDTDEIKTITEYKIKCFTQDHIDELGIGEVMRRTINYLDPDGSFPFHISFDIDALDPELCQATGTKQRGGLTPREANYIVRKLSNCRNIVGMDLVEINPVMETGKRNKFRGEQLYGELGSTTGTGIDLINSLFVQHLSL